MKPANLSVSEIGLIAMTRGMLGAGVALLNAEKLSREQRRAIGWTLVGVGVVTTIPLLAALFGNAKGGFCARE